MKIPFPVRAVPSLTFRAWMTPPPLPSRTARRDLEVVSRLEPCYFGGVPGYEIGEGPVVIAVHGWGGRPAQMVALASRLAEEGQRVMIPRLPGHAGGPPTDIKEVAAAIRAVIDDVGQPVAVIAHSFAAMVLRLAFRDEAPPRVALVAPALNVEDALMVFGDRLRLLPWARHGLRKRLQAWDPDLWPILSDIFPSQLPGADVLIVHDPDDDETPFARSAELAAVRPDTAILVVEDAGHSRVLGDETTLEGLSGFVTAGSEPQHIVA